LRTGCRSAAATGGERTCLARRLRLPLVIVRRCSAAMNGLRGAQSIQVELGLSTGHRGVSEDAKRSDYKAHVRSSREVDLSQPGARALVPRRRLWAPTMKAAGREPAPSPLLVWMATKRPWSVLGMLRALNISVERVFSPSWKETPRSKRKLARGVSLDRCAARENSPAGSSCFYLSSPLRKNIPLRTRPKSLHLSPPSRPI
jgi:hypothetical protein